MRRPQHRPDAGPDGALNVRPRLPDPHGKKRCCQQGKGAEGEDQPPGVGSGFRDRTQQQSETCAQRPEHRVDTDRIRADLRLDLLGEDHDGQRPESDRPDPRQALQPDECGGIHEQRRGEIPQREQDECDQQWSLPSPMIAVPGKGQRQQGDGTDRRQDIEDARIAPAEGLLGKRERMSYGGTAPTLGEGDDRKEAEDDELAVRDRLRRAECLSEPQLRRRPCRGRRRDPVRSGRRRRTSLRR